MKIVMKIAAWILGALVVIALGIFGLERLAAERVEVVELHTVDAGGEPVTTRLWIVDHEGVPYLRVGADGSGWYSRLSDNGVIELTRGDTRARYQATPRPELSDTINVLMQDKYTWGDTLIGYMVGHREGSIPIALTPADENVASAQSR